MMSIDENFKGHSISGNIVLDSGRHGINAPASARITDNFVSRSGLNGINVNESISEARAMIDKLPESKRSHWTGMLNDAISGAAGGLTVEALKGYLAAALNNL